MCPTDKSLEFHQNSNASSRASLFPHWLGQWDFLRTRNLSPFFDVDVGDELYGEFVDGRPKDGTIFIWRNLASGMVQSMVVSNVNDATRGNRFDCVFKATEDEKGMVEPPIAMVYPDKNKSSGPNPVFITMMISPDPDDDEINLVAHGSMKHNIQRIFEHGAVTRAAVSRLAKVCLLFVPAADLEGLNEDEHIPCSFEQLDTNKGPVPGILCLKWNNSQYSSWGNHGATPTLIPLHQISELQLFVVVNDVEQQMNVVGMTRHTLLALRNEDAGLLAFTLGRGLQNWEFSNIDPRQVHPSAMSLLFEQLKKCAISI